MSSSILPARDFCGLGHRARARPRFVSCFLDYEHELASPEPPFRSDELIAGLAEP
ncbi:MAG: hypothetical protein JO251_13180 [Verrucomicrobia bacterium]|nr:hypothetical protein [Verrucomicrobiota bacterium]